MKRRIWLIAVITVLVVVVVAVLSVLQSLDYIVKAAIERYGSEITGTAVRVSSVDISLTSGRGTLTGLTIANPSGFSSTNAFSLGQITLQLDTGTVTSNPVVIKEIGIGAPRVNYEVNDTGSVNVDVIRKNVEQFQASPGSGKKGGDGTSGDAGKDHPMKLIIDELSVRDGQVKIKADALADQELTAELPAIHLAEIGKSTGGATPGQVGEIVLVALVRSTVTAVTTSQLNKYLEKALGKKTGAAIGKGLEDVIEGGAKIAPALVDKLLGD